MEREKKLVLVPQPVYSASMRFTLTLLFMCQLASSQILTKVQDYPALTVSVTISKGEENKSISVRWDRIFNEPAEVIAGMAASPGMKGQRSKSLNPNSPLGRESLVSRPLAVNYTAIFDAAKKFLDSASLSKSRSAESPDAIPGSAQVFVSSSQSSCNFWVEGVVQPESFKAAEALYMQLEKCISPEQRELLMKAKGN